MKLEAKQRLYLTAKVDLKDFCDSLAEEMGIDYRRYLKLGGYENVLDQTLSRPEQAKAAQAADAISEDDWNADLYKAAQKNPLLKKLAEEIAALD